LAEIASELVRLKVDVVVTHGTTSVVAANCPPDSCTVDPTTTPASFFNATFRPGGYLGVNWQLSNKWVVGVEGDAGWGNTSMTRAGIPGAFGNGCTADPTVCPFQAAAVGLEAQGADRATVKLGWDGSVRGRFGVLVTPSVLLYGTGGVAFQQVEVSATCDGSADSWCVAPRSQSFSSVRRGWTLGGGAEAMLARNWLGRMELRYAKFGDFTNTFFAGTGDDIVTKVKFESTVTFLAGIGYKFDGAGFVVTR
jgi:outer membrane immunogenic protein